MTASGLMTTYAPLPVAFERGEGMWLYDTDGNRYIDAITGIAVCGLGHCHPKVTQALQAQAAKLVHTSNLYRIPAQEALGQRLTAMSGMDACFFGNSGAEANECAIKLSRMFGNKKAVEIPTIVVMEKSFHGRTLATLTATGNRKVQAGFEPLVKGFARAPYNDLEAVRTIVKTNRSVVAVMVEPIQGEGGIHIPDDNYLPGLRALCDEFDLLLIFDEIQTGNARTGKYFAYQHYGILPDIVTTAKGLGNGFPIGACLTAGKASSLFKPGNHGSTFGGNPLACTTAMAVLDTIEQDHLCDRAAHLGNLLVDVFKRELLGNDYVRTVRGKGLMIGIETTQPCAELPLLAKEAGLLINVTSDNVIRLLPALTLTDDEAHVLADAVVKIVKTWAGDERRRPRNP